MTNREYLIKQLSDENFIDDGGASYEATIFYHIACPYHCGNREALCKDIGVLTIKLSIGVEFAKKIEDELFKKKKKEGQ